MRSYITHPLGIFIIAIHTLYFVIALNIGSIYLVDSYGYLHQAKNIIQHHSWYAEDWNAPILVDYFTFRPPLYALIIIACKSIVASDFSILVVQNIMSIFNLFLLWKMLKGFNVSQKNINITLVLALLFYPSQMIHANIIMTEILFQTLLMGAFYFALQTWKSFSIKDVFKLCVLLSLAMLTKPVIFLFGIVLFVYFIILLWNKNKKVLLPLLFLPITFHVLCLQNQHTTGYYHYSSAKILADLRINASFILAKKYNDDSAYVFVHTTMDEANKEPNYKLRYTYIEQRCTDVYKENKLLFGVLHLKGMAATLLDPGRFDIAVFFNLQNNTTEGFLYKLNTEGIKAIPGILKDAPIFFILYLFLIFIWNLIVCLALVIFAFHKKTPLAIRVFVILFVGYIVGATGMSGLCRYRVPIFPEILFAIAFSLPILFSLLKRKLTNA